MNGLVMKYIFFLIIFEYNPANGDQCSKNGSTKCSRQDLVKKYTEGANSQTYMNLLRLIQTLQANHIPCKQEKCKCYLNTLKQDLAPYQQGIEESAIRNVENRGTKYQIISTRIHREKKCMFPARCSGIEHFLKKLAPKLPDMELIINTRDWPQMPKQSGVDPRHSGPVLSFSKTAAFYDLMYPAWAFWEGGPAIGLYPQGIGRWDEHRSHIARVANDTSWSAKDNRAFFRGSRTSSERDALVLLSRKYPELVDAMYTKNQAWKSDADTLHAPPAEEVSFTEHCKFKYLFNFRGVAASFRLKHILLCRSVVFHVGDDYQEFFYSQLKPWIHYVPVEADATESDLKELIEFIGDHDSLAQRIANNGFYFIWNHLTMKDVECYWTKLLKRYAKLLKYDIVKDDSLILI